MSDAVTGNTSHVKTSKARKTAFSNDVWAMQLSPSFLKQTNPHFRISAVSEDWLVVFARQEIVYDNWLLDTVYVEVDKVASWRVQHFCVEECHDILWIFSNRAQHSQEVAITKCPLINIIRIDPILENLSILIDLADPFPFNFLKAFLLPQWFQGRGELRILPWLAGCYDVVHCLDSNSDFFFVLLLFLLVFLLTLLRLRVN